LQIQPRQTIATDSLNPSSLASIEAIEGRRPDSSAQPADVSKQAPQFLQPIESLQRYEGQRAHFETRLTPHNDPSLTVVWLRNGVPIKTANRVTTTNEFGFIVLDVAHLNLDDAGVYTCRAKNDTGEAEVQATLSVLGVFIGSRFIHHICIRSRHDSGRHTASVGTGAYT
jgi:hypothetical protein